MDLNLLKIEMEKKGLESSYIEMCLRYGRDLEENGFPIIFDVKHLSLLMGIHSSQIYAYNMMVEKLYKSLKIPKKNGEFRTLSIPSENLKYFQRWILDNILYKASIEGAANGFVINKSIVDNAKIHIDKECVINLDIKDFFPSIDKHKIYLIFRNFGYSKHLSLIFTNLCTYNNFLPQGAPTSPYLSNIVCINLDKRIQELASRKGANYTRYADDITISGNLIVRKYISLLKRMIVEEGFEVNEKKVRVQLSHHKQMVTGLVVNDKLSVPLRTKKYLRQQIFFSKKFGVQDNLLKQEIFKANYKEHMYGIANFIKMVEPDLGGFYLRELDSIDWES